MNRKIILSNAFSIQMLHDDCRLSFKEVSIQEVRDALSEKFVSVIGHTDTANVLTSILGIRIECNRINITIDNNTILYVAQLIGGRLPEGSTTLPKGFCFKFYKVEIEKSVYYRPMTDCYCDNTLEVIGCDNICYSEVEMKRKTEEVNRQLREWKKEQLEILNSLLYMNDKEEIRKTLKEDFDSVGQFFVGIQQPKIKNFKLKYISCYSVCCKTDTIEYIHDRIKSVIKRLNDIDVESLYYWDKIMLKTNY